MKATIPPSLYATQPPKGHRAATDTEQMRKLALVTHGTGLAVKVAQEQCGYTGPTNGRIDSATWQDVRDDMYDTMLDDLDNRCGRPAE